MSVFKFLKPKSAVYHLEDDNLNDIDFVENSQQAILERMTNSKDCRLRWTHLKDEPGFWTLYQGERQHIVIRNIPARIIDPLRDSGALVAIDEPCKIHCKFYLKLK